MARTTSVLLVALALAPSACWRARGDAPGGAAGGLDVPATTDGPADAPDAEPPRTLPAFPGAEGFGRFSFGGRGGEVCHVTTLDDLGPGTLRNCLLVGRSHVTVVFEASPVLAASAARGG